MGTEKDRKPTDDEVLRGSATMVKLLRAAKIAKVLDECIPDGLRVALDTHSTATHCKIYLVDGDDELLVWYKTNWASPGYEFNEQGKVIGMQPGCEFAEPYLIHLFTTAIHLLEEKEKVDKAKAEAKIEAEKESQRDKVDRFRKKFQQ